MLYHCRCVKQKSCFTTIITMSYYHMMSLYISVFRWCMPIASTFSMPKRHHEINSKHVAPPIAMIDFHNAPIQSAQQGVGLCWPPFLLRVQPRHSPTIFLHSLKSTVRITTQNACLPKDVQASTQSHNRNSFSAQRHAHSTLSQRLGQPYKTTDTMQVRRGQQWRPLSFK